MASSRRTGQMSIDNLRVKVIYIGDDFRLIPTSVNGDSRLCLEYRDASTRRWVSKWSLDQDGQLKVAHSVVQAATFSDTGENPT